MTKYKHISSPVVFPPNIFKRYTIIHGISAGIMQNFYEIYVDFLKYYAKINYLTTHENVLLRIFGITKNLCCEN